MHVFVIDTEKTPQPPVHAAVARQWLRDGKAAVWRRYPFTIILKSVGPGPLFQGQYRLKLDPGSKVTGLAILDESDGRVVFAAELTHRGQVIKDALERRRALRRGRRQRKTRYRAARFLNRRRPEGWLAPSLEHRVETTLTWVQRLRRLCPITALSQELVRFDTQLMQDAEVSGVQYQRGTLYGTEVREYLLDKWQRTCAYCHKTDVPLEIEHIVPKSRGGADRVSNLTLACRPCNQRKGDRTAAEFGHPKVQAQAKAPLKDAAAVNATRWALYRRLLALGLPLEVGTGGRTKYNRTQRGLAKSHWADAANVGASTPRGLRLGKLRPLLIKAMGHGCRQMSITDRYGFPRSHKARAKTFLGFQTGDMCRAVIPVGKYAGGHVGRIAIRFQPQFCLNGFNVHPKYLTVLHRSDGYAYA